MEKFNAIVSNIFKMKEEEVADSLTSKDIPQWDSMNYLFLIAELEKEFKVQFTMDEVMNATCLGDIRAIVENRRK